LRHLRSQTSSRGEAMGSHGSDDVKVLSELWVTEMQHHIGTQL
jgi:hypothetical protein